MQILRLIKAGARVHARGEPWFVVHSEQFDDCALVTLRGTGESNFGTTTALLTPFDRLDIPLHSNQLTLAYRRATLRHAASAIARAHGWFEPWTAVAANIDLLPWQLEPAMAAIAGTTRVLLADAVGLGKTIQAGLIMAELHARGLASRSLILTPASLSEQWAAELQHRFRLPARVLDHASLAELVSSLPTGVNPWATCDVIVSSIDLVKRAEVRAALDGVAVDVLVVDEAHHLSSGTDRAAVVADLASRALWVVLVTATPHSGDAREYDLLQNLGAIGDDEIRIFRRGREHTGHAQPRRERFATTRLTAPEHELLERTMAYARSIWARHNTSQQAALVASVICRRATSSPAALAVTLSRRRELLAGNVVSTNVAQTLLPWIEEDPADAVESDAALGGARLDDPRAEMELLGQLIAAANAISNPAKFAVLARLIGRANEPAIVFSEYRDTLLALERGLNPDVSRCVIHGGMSTRERRTAVHAFTSGHCEVLLATDAAGEGLNLQTRCRLVLNMELPWNPVRLEQRIGRVDRLGQTRRVHAIHLVHGDSVEQRVLARLHQRRTRAAADLAAIGPDERAAAAAIFEDAPLGCDHPALTAAATPPLDVARTTAFRRAALQRSGRTDRPFPIRARCARARRIKLAHAVLLLFEQELHAADGRLIARELLPLLVRLRKPVFLQRSDSVPLVRALLSDRLVRRTLATTSLKRAAAIARELVLVRHTLERRLTTIVDLLRPEQTRLFQSSLFDKRAEQSARANAASRALLIDHANRRLAAARDLPSLAPSSSRLVAAWPWQRE